MRLERRKSYGELTRGQNECWAIYDASEQKCEAVSRAMIEQNLHIVIADFAGEDGNGFSSEFIVDKIHVEEFKAAFKQLKKAAQ